MYYIFAIIVRSAQICTHKPSHKSAGSSVGKTIAALPRIPVLVWGEVVMACKSFTFGRVCRYMRQLQILENSLITNKFLLIDFPCASQCILLTREPTLWSLITRNTMATAPWENYQRQGIVMINAWSAPRPARGDYGGGAGGQFVMLLKAAPARTWHTNSTN